MSRPRLLIATKAFWPVIGGVEETVRDIARAAAQDFDVTVLAVDGPRRSSSEQTEGYTVVRVAKLAKIFSAPLSLGYLPAFLRLARAADVVHLHSPYPPAEFSSLLSGSRARLVATYHLDLVKQRIVAPLYYPMLRAVLRRCDAIICSNPRLARTSPLLADHTGKIRIVSPGIRLGRYELNEEDHRAIASLKGRYRRPLVLFVGRLVYYKGAEYLVRAAAAIDIDLAIVGEGPLKRKLMQLSSELGIEERTHFLPHLPRRELVHLYHACDVFVLPAVARSETYGLVLLEAMAAGRPVISTEIGTGTSWINQDGTTGLVVQPRDSAALAAAIRRLADDPVLARRLGAAARERLKTNFTYEKFASDTIAVYRDLLS